ncbi:MAG TPA: hypothetical protein VGC29_06850, partial [Flavisolibacter sp.]
FIISKSITSIASGNKKPGPTDRAFYSDAMMHHPGVMDVPNLLMLLISKHGIAIRMYANIPCFILLRVRICHTASS